METGDYRTLAYDATTGHQRWVSSVRGLRKDSSATGRHHEDLAGDMGLIEPQQSSITDP